MGGTMVEICGHKEANIITSIIEEVNSWTEVLKMKVTCPMGGGPGMGGINGGGGIMPGGMGGMGGGRGPIGGSPIGGNGGGIPGGGI